MKILCVICQDQLSSPDDIFFTRCGHVFHHRCLLQWLERSETCPQCRNRVIIEKIHKAHFTVSNTDISADNVDNSTLQGRIDSLQFQILLNEKNIKYYTSKNTVLEKQNAGLRQEVRKVESEMRQKNSTIYALKEKINSFQKNYQECDVLKRKLSQKEREVEQFREDLRFFALCESENLALRHRVNELEKLLTSDQNCISRSSKQKCSNSLITMQTANIYNQQKNIKQETAGQNNSSTSEAEIEIIQTNQENSILNSTLDECPTVTKKARLDLQSDNNSKKINDVNKDNIKNTAGISSQSNVKTSFKKKN
ncbi:TRAF-interacting protein [Trachymyrmex septentrionalis]|uniref:TRAF-interacting protein n=1 Tax=Trachymyrmex septentrionalis TaxID=34720 RepID=A0A195FGG6_9HYME|nr:TRAF-interacting protein [Trachymyrmex septentrionalis]